MSTNSDIQKYRQAEFDKLLNTIDHDIPILFFPLRIETHFRKSKCRSQDDEQELIGAFLDLYNAYNAHAGEKDYNFYPALNKFKKVLENAEFVSDAVIVSLLEPTIMLLGKLAANHNKFSRHNTAILKAMLASVTNARLRKEIPSKNFKSINTPGRWEQIVTKEISKLKRVPFETNKAKPKELCVRIFPDEIFLDYLTDSLTEDEIRDGKTFWLQWFIASGNQMREYESWQALCVKYPVYRAAWIARQLKPNNINKFKSGGTLFYRRPYVSIREVDDTHEYVTMAAIEEACDDIYRNLAKIRIDERKPVNEKTGEYTFEEAIRKYIGIIKLNLYQIDRDVMSCEYIVDYLFDKIKNTIQYLIRRLNTYVKFYERYPDVYGGNNRQMEIWDVDQTMLFTFRKEAMEFLKKMRNKRIGLDEMIQKYLDVDMHNTDFFPDVPVNTSGRPDTPVSNILPERFMFIGEVAGSKKQIVHYGHKVRQNLQIGINPNENMEELPYKINDKGDLEISGGIDWMVDYDTAEKAGLAITVPLDGTVNEFNYVYVLGIKDTNGKDANYIESLFNSHNYTSRGLQMLKPGIPTNIVEGVKQTEETDPEIEMRRRYEIEIEEVYDNEHKKEYDSWRLSDMLNLNYNDCWGHTLNFDNSELSHAEKANAALWEYFMPKLLGNDENDENLSDKDKELKELLNFIRYFQNKHVKARGTFPLFKIENQPYGILPITLFQELDDNIKQGANSLLSKLNKLLVELAGKWHDIRKNEVPCAENLKDFDNPEKKYFEMAGMTPYSITFHERGLVNSPLLPARKAYVPSFFAPLKRYGYFDSLPIEGSEKEVYFFDPSSEADTAIMAQTLASAADKEFSLSTLAGIVKNALPEKVTDEECTLLVSEFMDIFTYRLDAWFTGILDYLLFEAKATKREQKRIATPPRIGAYGWVFNLKENPRKEVDDKSRKRVIEMMELSQNDSFDELKIYQNKQDDKGEYIFAPSIQHAITAAVLRGSYLKTKKDDADSHLCINLSSMRTRQALRMIEGIKQGLSTGIILGADLERYLHEAYRTGNEMDKYIYPLRKLFSQTLDILAEDGRANDHTMEVINGETLINTFIEKWQNSEPVASWLEKNWKKKEHAELEEWCRLLNEQTNIMNNHSHRKCLFKLIERVVDSYDALNDLLLAESVHRLVMGDRATYSAICNFMTEGKGNLPEPAILDTPMDYIVVSNRTAIALPKCNVPANCPMGLAEPSMNLWMENLIGDLKNIIFYVEISDNDGNAKFQSCSLHILDIIPIEYLYLSSNETLLLGYLETKWRLMHNHFTGKIKLHTEKPEGCMDEFVFLDDNDEEISDIFSLYEDELRISRLRNIVTKASAMQANDWTATAYNEVDEEMTVDTKDLESRYFSLRTYLSQLSFEMQSCLKIVENKDSCDDDTLAQMYELLCNCVESGMTSSLPAFNADMFVYYYKDTKTGDKEYHINPIIDALVYDNAVKLQKNFIKSFEYAHQELTIRISEAENIVRMTSDETYTSRQYIDAIQKLTLNNFKIFPRFTLYYSLPKEKREDYDAMLEKGMDCFDNLDRIAFDEWQSDVAEVRENMKLWHHVNMFQEICGANTGNIAILQADSEGSSVQGKWLGCKVEKESELQDVDSLVIYNSDSLTRQQSWNDEPSYNSGILIDAWTEFIPYKKQTAGMVFHCDQPDNEAPQSLLLAIHPKFNIIQWEVINASERTSPASSMRKEIQKWNLDNVLELLDSTKFMFMNRAIEPDHLYRDPELSTLFPLLSTIRLFKYTPPASSGYVPEKWNEDDEYNILDTFPGGYKLKEN
ncbi:hypothetical protein LJC53_01940 [Bacteroidales bacterium OttesenSCG-928-C03]|nr:hypothetical protein [Bacteroidales bacterium OttesenSCG-928-C03]MDL2326342.1 hypothetical protein [Bacteroidales bacterium OttesenSCG-928-A14]